METIAAGSAPPPTQEQIPGQLDLTAEPGWDGKPPHPQETPEYRAMEFNVEPLPAIPESVDAADIEQQNAKVLAEEIEKRVQKLKQDHPDKAWVYDTPGYQEGDTAVMQLPNGKREVVKITPSEKRGAWGDVDPKTGELRYEAVSLDTDKRYFTVHPGELSFISAGGKVIRNINQVLSGEKFESAVASYEDYRTRQNNKEEKPTPQDSPDYKALEFDVKPLVREPAPLLEMPDFSRPEERDWRRIEREAKTYFDEFEDPQEIIDLRQDLAGHEKAVKSALLKHFQELGIADVNNEYVIEKIVVQKTKEALASAKNKKIAELVQQALPYEEDSRKEKKQVDKAGESLARLLDMPQEQFDQLLKDWQHHEVNEAHGEALKEDKKYKIGEQRRAARGEITELDEKYGGVLAEISQLPFDKEAGGSTHQSIHDYFERKQKINSLEDALVEKADLEDVSVAQCVRDLQVQLRQKYQAEGLSAEQIQARLDESSGALETWLRHIDGNGIPLVDLQRYENQGNKEQMLSSRRQKAAEYIGSTLFMSALKGALRREKPAEVESEINVSEVFEHGIDHNGSRTQGGAEVLSNPEKAASFRGKVMAQLEMARTLSRNENTLMKALIYYTAVEKSLGTGFVSAWEAIPEEKKKQARKKLMLGMAATSTAIARMSAKATAKAKMAAATGAAAGTIWAGNKLKR